MGLSAISGCGAFTAFLSLLFTAIAIATNFWVTFDARDPTDTPSPLNPLLTNTELDGLVITYDVDHFGLWVGCHLERTFGGKKSCAYIGSRCTSNVCWIRNQNRDDTACLRERVTPIENCAAYQATRAMTILGTLALIVGASLLVVTVCINSSALSAAAGVMTFIGGVFLMIAFAVFYKEVFKDGQLEPLARIGWSFILLIVAWPLAIVASLIGCFEAQATKRELEDEDPLQSEG